jgi:hypothetical protein
MLGGNEIMKKNNRSLILQIHTILLFFYIFIYGCTEIKNMSIFGIYSGYIGNMKERISLSDNNVFLHEVFIQDMIVVSETGEFSVKGEMIEFSSFTEYYSPISKKISTSGKRFIKYDMFLLVGEGYSIIKPSLNQDYSLRL